MIVKRPRQADLAARLGVSKSTISRALADDAKISATLRREVQLLASAVGYKGKLVLPPPIAADTILVLMPVSSATSGTAGFYHAILETIQEAASQSNLKSSVRLVGETSAMLQQIERNVEQTGARYLLLAGIDPTDSITEWAIEREVVIILVNGVDVGMRVSSVCPANCFGAYLATKEIMAAGHRNIVHYTHPKRPTIQARMRGFEAAIASDPNVTGRVISAVEVSLAQLAEETVEGRQGHTAIFCWNDLTAVSLLEELQGAGVRVPEDIAVVGFDDLPCAQMTTPQLTTVKVDQRAIGRAAVRLVRQHLAGDTGIEQIAIGVTFVRGGTV